jgi:hypothetical protein
MWVGAASYACKSIFYIVYIFILFELYKMFVIRKVRGKAAYRMTNTETGEAHEHPTRAAAKKHMKGMGDMVHVDLASHTGKNYKMGAGDMVHVDLASHKGKNYKMTGDGLPHPPPAVIKSGGAGAIHIDIDSHNGKGYTMKGDGNFVRKVRGKALYAVYKNGVKQSEHETRGGALLASEVKGLTEASYKDRKNAPEKIGNMTLDKELSKGKARVYVDPAGKATVVTRGTKGISDWANNLSYLTGNYKKTDRYKVTEKVAKAAKEKYGDVQALGHSQGAVASRILAKKGIASSAIVVNPASKGEKPQKNVTVVKSARDPVSLLQKTRKGDVVIPSKTFNPLAAHSTDVVGALAPDKVIGGRAGARLVAPVRGKFAMEGEFEHPKFQFPADPVKVKKR